MTIEQIGQWVIDNRYPKSEHEHVSDFEIYHKVVDEVKKINEINEGDKVGYVENHRINNKLYRVFKIGIWDGEKGVLDDGNLVVRKKEWLFKITTQTGEGSL